MLDILREWWDTRSGRRQAEHEIKLIVSGYQAAADLFRRELPRIAKEGPRSHYSRGYYHRWVIQGFEDATGGKNRLDIFQNDEYETGWIRGIEKLRNQGFIHKDFDKEYMRLCEKRGVNVR